jgi:hypothetical protein
VFFNFNHSLRSFFIWLLSQKPRTFLELKKIFSHLSLRDGVVTEIIYVSYTPNFLDRFVLIEENYSKLLDAPTEYPEKLGYYQLEK